MVEKDVVLRAMELYLSRNDNLLCETPEPSIVACVPLALRMDDSMEGVCPDACPLQLSGVHPEGSPSRGWTQLPART